LAVYAGAVFVSEKKNEDGTNRENWRLKRREMESREQRVGNRELWGQRNPSK
jgi:hypothetical protein